MKPPSNSIQAGRPCHRIAAFVVAWAACMAVSSTASATDSLADLIDTLQPKIAKIHGAGGLRGLEPYQSGIVVSAEGHIATTWSYVLDTDAISVTLWDGRRFDATLVGADPRLEIALLKIDTKGLACFAPGEMVSAEPGNRILAISNLFGVATGDEPASAQQGVIAARTQLDARRGAFETPYRGPVYIVDAVTNNPGAAGGGLVDLHGRLVGMLGKELRNAQNYTWLNYAVPSDVLVRAIDDLRAGRVAQNEADVKRPADALSPARLGLVLVPDVLPRTPPYVEAVRPNSAADLAGMRPDDLVVMVGGKLTRTCAQVAAEFEMIDVADHVLVTVERGGELIELDVSLEGN